MKDIYYAVAHRPQAQIDSFKTRYEDFDDALIPDIFQNALGLKVKRWQPSDSWGSAHVIYLVDIEGQKRPLILRANTGWGEPEVVMLTEKLVTDKVLAFGLATNHILHVDVSRKQFPFDFQIQEDIGGTDPEVNFTDGQKEYDQLSFDIGAYIARLTKLKFSGFGRFNEAKVLDGVLQGNKDCFCDYVWLNLEDDLNYLMKEQLLRLKQKRQVLKVFEQAQSLLNLPQGSLLHHDLADHNLRYENGHLSAVFDWEAMVVGDPVLDLASCPTWKTLYPREEKLIEGFRSIKKLPDEYEAKRDIYRLRTILWKTVFVVRAKIATPERVERLIKALQPFKI